MIVFFWNHYHTCCVIKHGDYTQSKKPVSSSLVIIASLLSNVAVCVCVCDYVNLNKKNLNGKSHHIFSENHPI